MDREVTARELQGMDANVIIKLIEARLGHELSIEMQLRIAIDHGAREHGVLVIDPSPFAKEGPYTEKLDYEELAAFINRGPR